MIFEEEFLEEEEEEEEEKYSAIYVCEECDYRWEVVFSSEEELDRADPQICPMCGSTNTIAL